MNHFLPAFDTVSPNCMFWVYPNHTPWKSVTARFSYNLFRKHFLFFGSDQGDERGAQLYSLIGTCKLKGVAPESYLRHVLNVIADWPVNQVERLPWRVTLPAE